MCLVHCTKIRETTLLMLAVVCSRDIQNFTLVCLIIDRSLAEVNVSCTGQSFVVKYVTVA